MMTFNEWVAKKMAGTGAIYDPNAKMPDAQWQGAPETMGKTQGQAKRLMDKGTKKEKRSGKR